MNLVFDTNVFLQRHANLWELLEYFPTQQELPKFCVAIDEGQRLIEQEYSQYGATADEESPMRIISQRILDGLGWFVFRSPAELSQELWIRLDESECVAAVERTLWGVAESAKSGQPDSQMSCLVHPNDSNSLPISREYLKPGRLQQIQCDAVGPLTASISEILKKIRGGHEYSPSSFYELQSLLHQYCMGVRNSEERGFLEFKKPNGSCLSPLLLQNTVQAVCGMLNSRDGRVIIGVDPDTGEIAPFPPRYKDNTKPPSVDELMLDIGVEVDRICPRPGLLVEFWPIVDQSKAECVIVIQVRKGSREYIYRDAAGKLNAAKWIRRGNQTIVDPSWKPA